MATFVYKALSSDGKKISGKHTGNSKDEVIKMLKANSCMPLSIVEEVQKKEINLSDFFGKIKVKDIAVFCRQFYSILNAGVSIIGCLDILRQQTENKKLKAVIEDIYENVQKGQALSETMRKHSEVFPELLINMVSAGELSGSLDIIMDRMATHFEKENKVETKVKSAMVYPIILSVVAVLVVVFLLIFVMPTFVGMFEGSGAELPGPTKVVLNISNAIKSAWFIILPIIGGIVYGLKTMAKSEKGSILIDEAKLKIPIVSDTTKKVITSRFTRTLSTLLSSGIPLLSALEIVAKVVGNKIIHDGIMDARDQVRKGIPLSEPIKQLGYLPPMVTSMIKIGEETGSLDEILNNTANFYDNEVEAAIQRMTTMIEPIMIVFMALVVGSIVIAMILPMFDMINTVQM